MDEHQPFRDALKLDGFSWDDVGSVSFTVAYPAMTHITVAPALRVYAAAMLTSHIRARLGNRRWKRKALAHPRLSDRKRDGSALYQGHDGRSLFADAKPLNKQA